jgi:hypothetical protein
VERLERHAFSEDARRQDAGRLRKLQRTGCRADGLIYVGATASLPAAHANSSASFVSVDPATGSTTSSQRDPPTVAALFLPGHALPLVSALNQDDLGPNRPLDYLLAIKRGANYGFPTCPANPSTCSNYDQPSSEFPAHASPMGLGYLNGKLYVALYGGLGKGPVVVSMPPGGGTPTPSCRVPCTRDRTRHCRRQPLCRRSERRDLSRYALTEEGGGPCRNAFTDARGACASRGRQRDRRGRIIYIRPPRARRGPRDLRGPSSRRG